MSRTIRKADVCTKSKCSLCKPHKRWPKTSKFDNKRYKLLRMNNIDLHEYEY